MESAHRLINSRWIFRLDEEWRHHECWCWNIWLLQARCTREVYLLSGRFQRIVVQDNWRNLSLRRWAWNWIWAVFDYTSDPGGLVGDGKQFGVDPKSSWEVWVSTGVRFLRYTLRKFLKNLIFRLLSLLFNDKKPPEWFCVFRSDQSKHLVCVDNLENWQWRKGSPHILGFFVKQRVETTCQMSKETDVVGSWGKGDQQVSWRGLLSCFFVQQKDSDVSAQNEVMSKRRIHLNSTWLCALKGIPTLVRAFNPASIWSNILAMSSQASFLNMTQLVSVYLG